MKKKHFALTIVLFNFIIIIFQVSNYYDLERQTSHILNTIRVYSH